MLFQPVLNIQFSSCWRQITLTRLFFPIVVLVKKLQLHSFSNAHTPFLKYLSLGLNLFTALKQHLLIVLNELWSVTVSAVPVLLDFRPDSCLWHSWIKPVSLGESVSSSVPSHMWSSPRIYSWNHFVFHQHAPLGLDHLKFLYFHFCTDDTQIYLHLNRNNFIYLSVFFVLFFLKLKSLLNCGTSCHFISDRLQLLVFLSLLAPF